MKKAYPFLFLFVILLAACNGGSNPASTLPSGILQGTVTIGPLCPVENPKDPTCKPKPELYTSHKLVILDKDGSVAKTVDIDGNGNYQTYLMPGSYLVDFSPHDIGRPGAFKPPTAIIESDKTTLLDIHIDTGLR